MAASNKIRRIRLLTAFSAVLGLTASIYALHVETAKEHDQAYKAMCDVSEHMSCTKVFTSKYGTGFGFVEHITGKESILNQPNSVYGIIFYSVLLLLSQVQYEAASRLQLYMAILSNIGSIYLGSILYFILYDFCLVCVFTYIINAIILVLSVMKLATATTEHYQQKEQPPLPSTMIRKRV